MTEQRAAALKKALKPVHDNAHGQEPSINNYDERVAEGQAPAVTIRHMRQRADAYDEAARASTVNGGRGTRAYGYDMTDPDEVKRLQAQAVRLRKAADDFEAENKTIRPGKVAKAAPEAAPARPKVTRAAVKKVTAPEAPSTEALSPGAEERLRRLGTKSDWITETGIKRAETNELIRQGLVERRAGHTSLFKRVTPGIRVTPKGRQHLKSLETPEAPVPAKAAPAVKRVVKKAVPEAAPEMKLDRFEQERFDGLSPVAQHRYRELREGPRKANHAEALALAGNLDRPASRKTRVNEYNGLTREQFDALPADRKKLILDDLKSISESGDKRTIPSNRTSMGTTIRGVDATHVTQARSLRDRFTRTPGPTKAAKPEAAPVLARLDDKANPPDGLDVQNMLTGMDRENVTAVAERVGVENPKGYTLAGLRREIRFKVDENNRNAPKAPETPAPAKAAPAVKRAVKKAIPEAVSEAPAPRAPRKVAAPRPRASAEALREKVGQNRADLEGRLSADQKKELGDLSPRQRARYWVRRVESGDDHNSALSKATGGAAPAAARPVVKRATAPRKVATKAAAPEAPAKRMTREQLMQEINRRRDAGEDLHAYDQTFTRDELERVLKGESVELRGSQRRKAAKARAAARAEEVAQAPVTPRKRPASGREVISQLQAAKTDEEAAKIIRPIRSRQRLDDALRTIGSPPTSDKEGLEGAKARLLESMRPGVSAPERPVVKRAAKKVAAKAAPKTFGDMLKEAPPESMDEVARKAGLTPSGKKTAEAKFDDLVRQIVEREAERRGIKLPERPVVKRAAKKVAPEAAPGAAPARKVAKAAAPSGGYRAVTQTGLPRRKSADLKAKEWGAFKGYRGNTGGWLSKEGKKTDIQGWDSLYKRHGKEIEDWHKNNVIEDRETIGLSEGLRPAEAQEWARGDESLTNLRKRLRERQASKTARVAKKAAPEAAPERPVVRRAAPRKVAAKATPEAAPGSIEERTNRIAEGIGDTPAEKRGARNRIKAALEEGATDAEARSHGEHEGTVAATRKEVRATVRQQRIRRKRETAIMLGEVDELLRDKPSDRALQHRIRSRAGVSKEFERTDINDVRDRLLATGTDREKMRAEVKKLAQEAGIKRIGESGQVVPFDPAKHHPGGDASIKAGTPVQITRPGYEWNEPGGTLGNHITHKATVFEAPEAPTKAARPAAKRAAKAAASELTPSARTRLQRLAAREGWIGIADENDPEVRDLIKKGYLRSKYRKFENGVGSGLGVQATEKGRKALQAPETPSAPRPRVTRAAKKAVPRTSPLQAHEAEPEVTDITEVPHAPKAARKAAVRIPAAIKAEPVPEGADADEYYRARARGFSKKTATGWARGIVKAREGLAQQREAEREARAAKIVKKTPPRVYGEEPDFFPRKVAERPKAAEPEKAERPTIRRVAKKVAAAVARPFRRQTTEKVKQPETTHKPVAPRLFRDTLTPGQLRDWESLEGREERAQYQRLRKQGMSHEAAMEASPRLVREAHARGIEQEKARRKPRKVAQKVAPEAGAPERPKVTRAGAKVESADDVIANRGTVVRLAEHPGWDIVQHDGNKRWYILDPDGKLHKDGRISSSSSLENAQKRLARVAGPPKAAPAKRVAKKAAPEAPSKPEETGPSIAQLAKEAGFKGDAAGIVPSRQLDLDQGMSRADVAKKIRRDATNLEKSPLDQGSTDPSINRAAREDRADFVRRLRDLADRVEGKEAAPKRPAVKRAAKKAVPPAAPEVPAKATRAPRKVAAKAAPEAATPERPVVKRAAPRKVAAPESKELKPLTNGTRRKSMTNVQEGDVVRGASGARGGSEVPRRVTKVERDGNSITITRDDGSTLKGNANTAVWLGEAPKAEAPAAKRAVKKAAPSAPEAPAKAIRPRVTRAAAKKAVPEAPEAPAKKAAPAKRVAKKAAPEAPEAPAKATRPRVTRAGAKKTAPEAAAPEAPAKAARPASKQDLSKPEVQRARASLLHQGDRNLSDDAVAQEMDRIKRLDDKDTRRLRALRRTPLDQNVPLRGDPQGDNSVMHGDSPSMELAQKLARRGDRNGSANKVMDLRRSYSSREGKKDLDASEKAVQELRLMRLEEKDPEVRKLYDEAIAQMDAEPKSVPDVPEGTPQSARQLLSDLNRIPLARRMEPSRDGERISATDQLAQVYRDIDSGKLQGSGDIDKAVDNVLSRYHESRDGSYQMQDLGPPGSDKQRALSRDLRQWARDRETAGPHPSPTPGSDTPKVSEPRTDIPDPNEPRAARARKRLEAREAHHRRSTADGSAELADMLNQVIEARQGNDDPAAFRRAVRQRLLSTPGEKTDPKTQGYDDLRKALTGESFTNPEELGTRLRQELAKRGVTMTSTPGAQTRFNPDLHRSVGGDIPDNADVQVIRPGLIFTDKDGTVVTLQKPVVKRVTTAPVGEIHPRTSRGKFRDDRSAVTKTLDRAVDKIFGSPTRPAVRRAGTKATTPSHRSTQRPLTGKASLRTGDLFNGDTDSRGVPVRDFTPLLGGGYTIKNGTAWRRNGVTYVVEHDETGEGKRRAIEAAKVMEHHHQSLPAGARQYQRSYVWNSGSNPEDPEFAKRLGVEKFRSVMTAGSGDTHIWQPGVKRTPEGRVDATQLISDLNHEFGHNADTDGISGSGGWHEAGANANPARYINPSTWVPSSARGGRAKKMLLKPQPGARYPYGITPYGGSSDIEDFAESVDLYLQGKIGYGELLDQPGMSALWFRDLFPERAAILDKLFPEVARQQRDEIAKLEAGPRRRRVTPS